MKPISAFLVALLFLFAAASASAQTGGSTGTSLSSGDFEMYFERDVPNDSPVRLNVTSEAPYYFNRARCECEDTIRIYIREKSTYVDTNLRALLQSKSSPGSGKLYIGPSGCLSDIATRKSSCTNLLAPGAADDAAGFALTTFTTNGFYESPSIPITRLFDPGQGAVSSCSTSTATQTKTIFFWIDTAVDGTADVTDGPTLAVSLDSTPPPAPIMLEPQGGNNAVTVKWTPASPPGDDANFRGFVVFCAGPDGAPVFPGKHGLYSTAGNLCKKMDAGTSSKLTDLDEAFICSDMLTSTDTNYRIKDLVNDLTYTVAVAAVDKSGNISPITDVRSATATATVDFYTYYRGQDGQAEGGYCALARRRPTGIGMFALLAVAGLVLAWRRRRKGRRKQGPPGTLLILALGGGIFFAARAQAQLVYHDNTFLNEKAPEIWHGSPQDFAIEARFGMYSPNVDSEFSGDKKPHEFIFGSKQRPMWQLEFDWQFWRKFGTLAVGGVIGYFKENAKACLKAELLAQPDVCKASEDTTSLRLIPFAALLVYRMDILAERMGIPVMPYAKFGFNYTFWTVTDGNGATPSSPKGGHGSGGTAGWQASLGLALQLDFLDPAAARGFDADVGVNHSYIFFELDHVASSGLTQSHALHVGDSTWFLGLLFEF
jgi:hypothetical protein